MKISSNNQIQEAKKLVEKIRQELKTVRIQAEERAACFYNEEIGLPVERIESGEVFVAMRGWNHDNYHAVRPDIMDAEGRMVCPFELVLIVPPRLGMTHNGVVGLYAVIKVAEVGLHPCWAQGVEVVEHHFEPKRYDRQRKTGEYHGKTPILVSPPPAIMFADKYQKVFGTERLVRPVPDNHASAKGNLYKVGRAYA